MEIAAGGWFRRKGFPREHGGAVSLPVQGSL
jgi:hypothetical protein